MSGNHDGHGEKKTLGQKIGDILVATLLVVLGIWFFTPLLGFGLDGLTGIINTFGTGSINLTTSLGNAQVAVMGLIQKFLMWGFQIAALAVLGMFGFFIVKKVIKSFKDKENEGHTPPATSTPPATPPATPHH